jgi:hypothetical protein
LGYGDVLVSILLLRLPESDIIRKLGGLIGHLDKVPMKVVDIQQMSADADVLMAEYTTANSSM